MGCGSKNLELPAPPTYQSNPTFKAGYQGLADYGNRLATGDLTGNLSWLKPTINPNNSALALQSAQGLLQPQFRDTLNQITQSAANNNQLNSSTFTDALARSQSDLNSQYQSIVSQQAIADNNQANENRLGLLGTGLNTLQAGAGLAGQDQNSQNSFNLENYQNQVAAAIAGQKQQSGGLLGSLTGGVGGAGLGAGLGALLALPTGGLSIGAGALFGGLAGGGAGALLGGLSPASSNVGGNLLGSAGSLAGNFAGGNLSAFANSGKSAPFAGAFASNLNYNPNAFNNTSSYSTPNLSNPFFANGLGQ